MPFDTTPQRVLIADRLELFRRGLRDVIAQEPNLHVAAEIADLSRLADANLELTPDLILLGMDREAADEAAPQALEALRQVMRLDPYAAVIVFIADEDVEQFIEAVRAGAKGVLLRDASADAILRAVEAVWTGGAALDPRLARQLFERLASGQGLTTHGIATPDLDPGLLQRLSPRERDVLALLAQGRRNKEIAAQLGVSVGTVKTHLRHIFRKLSVDDRTSAVLTALRARLPDAA
jgi:DNA-binding NarL/FixJ family response regulator